MYLALSCAVWNSGICIQQAGYVIHAFVSEEILHQQQAPFPLHTSTPSNLPKPCFLAFLLNSPKNEPQRPRNRRLRLPRRHLPPSPPIHSQPPPYTLYALVRSPAQAQAVQNHYNATPLTIDLSSPSALTSAIVDNKISIIYHLHEPLDHSTPTWIAALAQVKRDTGRAVHFIFTTGAKLFSSHAGAPSTPFSDTSPDLYALHAAQPGTAPVAAMARGAAANTLVVDAAERMGVQAYVFAPCIVYGRGLGFGNKISIQTVAVVKAAKALRRVWAVDEGRPSWPVCHVVDNSTLYVEMLRGMLEGRGIGSGKAGFFLASPGSVVWRDLYAAVARAMARRGLVDDESVGDADGEVLERMGEALKCPAAFVPMQVGGLCTFIAEHGKKIGWTPQYAPEHILEAADDEVELILEHLDGARSYAIPAGTKLK